MFLAPLDADGVLTVTIPAMLTLSKSVCPSTSKSLAILVLRKFVVPITSNPAARSKL